MGKCEACNTLCKELEQIRVSSFNGFCHFTENVNICEDCLKNRIFRNSYGFEFIVINKKLYMRQDPDLNFELAHSKDVDRAFDPERAAFEEWRLKCIENRLGEI